MPDFKLNITFAVDFFLYPVYKKVILLLNKLFKIQKSMRMFYYRFTKPKNKSSFNSWSKNVFCTAHKLREYIFTSLRNFTSN